MLSCINRSQSHDPPASDPQAARLQVYATVASSLFLLPSSCYYHRKKKKDQGEERREDEKGKKRKGREKLAMSVQHLQPPALERLKGGIIRLRPA